ncbi:hypothetical protein [Halioxenophilus sp. WMMB6]|uniref:hypothetical protein n=1 Tax=Halioxenophilus sp. WMMB6 TaxID=3073815 RepID=UPI00295EA847|nr:hypothetical protein [Halioxenophilus sp. WMMB6]
MNICRVSEIFSENAANEDQAVPLEIQLLVELSDLVGKPDADYLLHSQVAEEMGCKQAV